MSHRKIWRPRRPELPSQCASCPFLKDNDAEFHVFFNRLRVLHGKKPVKSGSKMLKAARQIVRMDIVTMGTGEFICHQTVYDQQMKMKPVSEHRQCPGAANFWREL